MVSKDTAMERKVTTTERVLNYILEELDAGRLGPGDRVNAAKVAATLEISAAPVREALAILAGRGIVDLHPDRGAIVRAMDADEVCELFEIISAVVVMANAAAARAVARGENTAEIVRAYEAIGENRAAMPPVDFYMRLNDYHFALNNLAGKRMTNEAMDRLGLPYWNRFLASFIDIHAEMPTYLNTYRRMHEAVMAGDEMAAAAVVNFHCAWSIARVKAAAALPRGRRRRGRKVGAT